METHFPGETASGTAVNVSKETTSHYLCNLCLQDRSERAFLLEFPSAHSGSKRQTEAEY